MPSATFGQQTKALVNKSWTYQKRNIGSNICLCIAPIFFCIVLAVIQVLVNRLFISGDNFKCGCLCTQCCPAWALQSAAGNYTANGNGTITVTNPAAFAVALPSFSPSQVTNNPDGTVTIETCGVVSSGACPSELGYTCLKSDTSRCGIQYSSPAQSQWCAVPRPSAWPALAQVPDPEERASPWGATVVNGVLVRQAASMVTAKDPGLTASVASTLFPGTVSTDPAMWSRVLSQIYGGNASDPAQGNVLNGDLLSLLGLQFGTNSALQVNLYLERAFATRRGLYVLLPVATCTSKNIPTDNPVCLAQLLRLLWAGNSAAVPLLPLLPQCQGDLSGSQSTERLLSALALSVTCTEVAVVPQASSAALEDKLYCSYTQSRCQGQTSINMAFMNSFDLGASNSTQLELNMYWNDTFALEPQNAGGGIPRIERLPGPLSAAVSAWWQAMTGDASSAIELLGIMSMPKAASKLTLDFGSVLGPLFFTWVVQLLLPTFLQQLVYEKEKRLRIMMKMHGLGDGVYWLVTYLWYLAVYCIYISVLLIFGALIGLNVFRKTSGGIQVIFYFLHGNCMVAFCFLLSSLFTSSKTATVFGFLYVFATGLIAELLLKDFMGSDKPWLLFVQWVPAWSLYRGLYEQAEYTSLAVYKSQPGMQFRNLHDKGNAMITTWVIFIIEWALFLLLGLYLEQVLSNGTGIRRHPLFFLECLWKKKGDKEDWGHVDTDRHSLDRKISLNMDGMTDVQAEMQRVDNLTTLEDHPIVVRGIRKVYPALDGGKPKVAVRNMTVAIRRGECFGLLGPNGAGKTTSISMLCGFQEPSAGTAVVEGHDITTNMKDIYKLMGVCPQHDLQWEQLTGREHLQFYGRLKGLNGQQLDAACEAALRSVNLWTNGVGNKPSGKYSGGMRRRLSVAISFMGDPRVCYLDEPSTGLDPASRRNLWDKVKGSKAGRSIILTTHSMEEAEMLCDRLGIFVDGQLVCIGNPKEITSRYAGFFVFSITVPLQQEAAARQLVLGMSPSATLTYALGGTLKYELPTSEVTLSKVFECVNAAKAQLSIVDWGVASATLEEVFIKLAKSVGAQSKDQ